jgi:hypothetical protein
MELNYLRFLCPNELGEALIEFGVQHQKATNMMTQTLAKPKNVPSLNRKQSLTAIKSINSKHGADKK